jgi:hypothetical protein
MMIILTYLQLQAVKNWNRIKSYYRLHMSLACQHAIIELNGMSLLDYRFSLLKYGSGKTRFV